MVWMNKINLIFNTSAVDHVMVTLTKIILQLSDTSYFNTNYLSNFAFSSPIISRLLLDGACTSFCLTMPLT